MRHFLRPVLVRKAPFLRCTKLQTRPFQPPSVFGQMGLTPPMVLIGLNTFVFGMWQTNPRFCKKHFVYNQSDIRRGKFYTPFTSLFSHITITHFLVNSLMLYVFGQMMLPYVTAAGFYKVYFGAGIASSAVMTMFMQYGQGLLGSSGAVFGLLGYMTMKTPHAQMAIFGVIPAKLWHVTCAIAAYDLVYSQGNRFRSTMDAHQGHIMGILSGLLICYLQTRMGLRL